MLLKLLLIKFHVVNEHKLTIMIKGIVTHNQKINIYYWINPDETW